MGRGKFNITCVMANKVLDALTTRDWGNGQVTMPIGARSSDTT